MPPDAAPPTSPYGGLYSPQDIAAARAIVGSQVDPLVAGIADRVRAQTKAGMGAIGGYTNQLAQSLGGFRQSAAKIWGGAQQAQAASDAALSQTLSGQGAQLATELSGKLGAINAPGAVTEQVAGGAAATGQGAAGALYGRGSAELGSLIAQGGAAQEYAAKLPGLAGLGGLQSARALELQQGATLADQTRQVEEQVPGLVRDTLGQLSTARAQREQLAFDRQKQQQANALAVAKQRAAELQQRIETTIALGYDPTTGKLTQKAQNDLAKLRLEQQRVNNQANAITAANQRTTAQIKAQNKRADAAEAGRTARTQAQSDAAAAKVDPTLSAAYGVQVNAQGHAIPGADGKPIPYKPYVKPTTAKGAKGSTLTAAQSQKYVGVANTIALNGKRGFATSSKTPDYPVSSTPQPGGWSEPTAGGAYINHHPALTYEQAVDEMRKAGVPDRIAQATLRRVYRVTSGGVPAGANVNPATNSAAAGPPAP